MRAARDHIGRQPSTVVVVVRNHHRRHFQTVIIAAWRLILNQSYLEHAFGREIDKIKWSQTPINDHRPIFKTETSARR